MKIRIVLAAILLTGMVASEASAAWVWTPQTRRWINPKFSAKDTPSSQMEWAMSFFEVKEYKRAAKEFVRLVRTYPRSELAPEAQYLLGVSYELMDRPGNAYNSYRKLAEVYPFSARFKDSIEREYLLADSFFNGKKVELIGPLKIHSLDKAIEIYQHVVDHAPYGAYGDKAQFKLGECYLTQNRLVEASRSFQKLVDDYPASELVEQSQFKIATCAKGLSLKASYDQSATDEAIEWYESFIASNPDSAMVEEAESSLVRLHEIKAKGLAKIAGFYETKGKSKSAAVYYREILHLYPDTHLAAQALAKLTEFEQLDSLEE